MSQNIYSNQVKICLVCKREFTNRKSYIQRGDFENVKYCSQKCRKNKNKINEKKLI